ncbi:unnamed protein product [Owenia fusiformis]|uniref:Uncharacterized protein n=1 Tax=Owenia fusiformis TaxID=6347 RepID=A0A8J1YAW5_OWEFU|nr:unnamed protein product [Owenia fusiformis]
MKCDRIKDYLTTLRETVAKVLCRLKNKLSVQSKQTVYSVSEQIPETVPDQIPEPISKQSLETKKECRCVNCLFGCMGPLIFFITAAILWPASYLFHIIEIVNLNHSTSICIYKILMGMFLPFSYFFVLFCSKSPLSWMLSIYVPLLLRIMWVIPFHYHPWLVMDGVIEIEIDDVANQQKYYLIFGISSISIYTIELTFFSISAAVYPNDTMGKKTKIMFWIMYYIIMFLCITTYVSNIVMHALGEYKIHSDEFKIYVNNTMRQEHKHV